MKKFIWGVLSIATLTLFISGSVFAQGMMGSNQVTSAGHTAREEAEGKVIWEKLQAKQMTCTDLSDENFGSLGEYFMGQMMGNSHEAMNNMMIQMMGEDGEEQMHVVMGKRLSGCDTSAAVPSQGVGFMPMMNMLTFFRQSFGGQVGGMNFGSAFFGWVGWIFMVLWWILIIAGLIALIKWLVAQYHHSHNYEKSPLEILKERYARGEIDKKEFEEKKKGL